MDSNSDLSNFEVKQKQPEPNGSNPLNLTEEGQEDEEKKENKESSIESKNGVKFGENNTVEAVHQRLEVVGLQKGLFGKDIPLTQFKNLEAKRELKEKIKAMFNGQIIRSIITPKNIDGNKRVKGSGLDREKSDRKKIEDDIIRSDKFSKKTIDVLSIFPSVLTQVYLTLLSKEGDKCYDPFVGHNSRAEDVLSLNRKYYGYDIHTYPVEMTRSACSRFVANDYEINLGSSEKVKYADESMDFSITCPPYADIENYNKVYEEFKAEDLSGKNYNDFLWTYSKCLGEVYRVLKKGSYFVCVVGDSHKGGEYRSLMLDTIKICKMVGFKLHTIDIYNRMSNIGGDLNFGMFVNKLKYFPTIHEFCLVFKKT